MESARSVSEWPSFLRQSTPSANGSFVSMSPRMGNYRAAMNTTPLRAPSADDNMRMKSYSSRPVAVTDTAGGPTSQNNRSIDKLWDFMMREQKDRIEGYRELQARLHQQQDALNSIALRAEKSIDDFVRQDLSNMRDKFDVVSETQSTYCNRVDELSQEIEKLSANSCRCETSLEDLRELVTCKFEQEGKQVDEVRENLHSLKEQTTVAMAEVQQFMRGLRTRANDSQAIDHGSDETDAECNALETVDLHGLVGKVPMLEGDYACDQTYADETAEVSGAEDRREGAELHEPALENECSILANELADQKELRESLVKLLEERIQDCQDEGAVQVTDLERRMSEEWTGLRGWVDAAVVAVVNRISSLESTLQTEMADRLASTELVSEGTALNQDQIKRMQSELDKLVFDMKVIAVSNTFKKSSSKSDKIATDDLTKPKQHAADSGNTGHSSEKCESNTPTKANVEAPLGAPSAGGSTSIPPGSLQQKLRSPQILSPGGVAPAATREGPFSPRLYSQSVSSQTGTQVGIVSGQSLSAPMGQEDPLLRSTPRANLPFMASVPMAYGGSHSTATSPLRAAFAYPSTSPLRNQPTHIRR